MDDRLKQQGAVLTLPEQGRRLVREQIAQALKEQAEQTLRVNMGFEKEVPRLSAHLYMTLNLVPRHTCSKWNGSANSRDC